jgi:dihydropteroate synthase
MAHAPRRLLEARGRELELGRRPLIMGIVNATPDSFSDGGAYDDLASRLARGRELVEAGADLIDVGGESGVTVGSAVDPAEEIERVAPLIEGLTSELGAIVSVDTYKPQVARAAIEAGAVIVNDASGLSDPELATVCAETGAALVVTHTRARPKQKLTDPRYADVTEDVKRFLGSRMKLVRSLGVSERQMLLCVGPDMGKEPAQTIDLLRHLEELHELGRPLLLAVSRKDFVGALVERHPRDRLAGTLAAVAHVVARGAHVLRLHDVAEARDFLTVLTALEGEVEIPRELRLADELRREPVVERAAEGPKARAAERAKA